MQKYVSIVIHNVVSRVISFVRNIIDLHRCINISLVIKFSLKTGMGWNNPVIGSTIK